MNKENRSRIGIAAGLLLVIITGIALAALPTSATIWRRASGGAAPRADRAALETTVSSYVGVVDLAQVLPAELTDNLAQVAASLEPAETPDLGQIDLGFRLVQAGTVITGHVDLRYTLVFTGEHQLEGDWYGPEVEGTLDGGALQLTSDPVTFTSAGMPMQRQFSLTGSEVEGQEGWYSGEYRETIWGYGPQAYTVVGTFTLQRGDFVAPVDLPQTQEVYLPIIVR